MKMTVFGQDNLDALRHMFHSATSKQEVLKLLDIEVNDTPDTHCVEHAYQAAATVMMADYVKWPGTKYKYFKNGSSRLDSLITTHPCLESVYLRLLLQYGAPRILGYSENIKGDSTYFRSQIENSAHKLEDKIMFISTLNEVSENSYEDCTLLLSDESKINE